MRPGSPRASSSIHTAAHSRLRQGRAIDTLPSAGHHEFRYHVAADPGLQGRKAELLFARQRLRPDATTPRFGFRRRWRTRGSCASSKKGSSALKNSRRMEAEALDALRAYDRGEADLEDALLATISVRRSSRCRAAL